MKIKLLPFFSVLAYLGLLLSSCQKELSNENGTKSVMPTVPIGTSSGTAVYTYSGVAGNCSTPQISGKYVAGASATLFNTVVLQVTVVTTGTYRISTATINGIIFTGTGNFSTAGVQTITLFANGIPTAAGSFNYIPGTNGCAYNILFIEGNSSSAVFIFPSAPNACNLITVNGDYNAGEGLSLANTVTGVQVNVTTPGTYYLTTVPNNGITFTSTGSFTTTGMQTITLVGSGTPITSGSFTYSPGNNGCSFSITILPAEPLPTDYIKCKINGVSSVFIGRVSFTEIEIPATPPVPAATSLDITGNLSNTSDENISLTLSKIGNAIVAGETFDPNGFASGKIYLITYTDAAAKEWNAVLGFTETPFTIKITNKTATRLQGTFSGTVSDSGTPGGKLKIITDGSFNVPVQ